MPRAKFTPTEQQRQAVEMMAAANMSQEAMAGVTVNPNTNRPVKVETLVRAFRDELRNAKTRMRKLILQQYVKKLEEGDWRAIEYGLKYYLGLGSGNATISIDADPNSAMNRGITVSFVSPDPNRWKDDPPPVSLNGPRPISRAEHYDEANVKYPHRIDHEPVKPSKTGWMK
jgi:hypothetical protein